MHRLLELGTDVRIPRWSNGERKILRCILTGKTHLLKRSVQLQFTLLRSIGHIPDHDSYTLGSFGVRLLLCFPIETNAKSESGNSHCAQFQIPIWSFVAQTDRNLSSYTGDSLVTDAAHAAKQIEIRNKNRRVALCQCAIFRVQNPWLVPPHNHWRFTHITWTQM